MANTDLQVVYMDSSNWGVMSPEEIARISSPAPAMERRLRPQHDQALKCPRCESTHTKFCYYNNYSLSQPRYFCKTCRRYWTKGGTLRNIPVGGGCRKNTKKSSSSTAIKKPSIDFQNSSASSASSSPLILNNPEINNAFSSFPLSIFTSDQTNFSDLQLGFSDQLQYSSLNEGLFPPAANGYFLENPVSGNELSAVGMVGFDKFPENFHGADAKPILSLEWHENHQQQVCSSGGYINVGSWTGLMNGFGSSATNPLI